MNKNKPDALLVLAVIFGVGLLISTLTHGDNDQDQAVAQNASQYAGSSYISQ